MKRLSKARGKGAKVRRLAASKPNRASTQTKKSLPNSTAAGAPGEIARLTRELNEALEREAATSQVLEVLRGSPGDLQAVFVAVLENAVRLCDANFGMLWQYEGKGFRCIALHNAPSAFSEDLQKEPVVYPPPGSGLRILAETRQVIHVADLAAMPTYTQQRAPAIVAAVELGGVRTYVAVPMLKKNELIGALIAYRQEVHPFSEKQIELVKNFAAQAAIAIENARLLNELRQRTSDLSEALEQQTATSEILKIISSSPGKLEPVFAAILENAARICGATLGSLNLCENDSFRVIAMHGVEPTLRDKLQGMLLRLAPNTALGRLSRRKQITHIADVLAEPGFFDTPAGFDGPYLALEAGARTLLAVPMLKDTQLIGGILIYRQVVRPFTEKQITLVASFAAQAVIAIENARLLTELRQRTDDLSQRTADLTEALEQQTATAEVLKVISRSQFDLQLVLDTLIETAASLCRAERGVILRRDGDLYRGAAFYNATQDLMDFVKSHPVTPGRHTITARVALERRAIHVADLQEDAEYTYALRDTEPIRTEVGVPMFEEMTSSASLSYTSSKLSLSPTSRSNWSRASPAKP